MHILNAGNKNVNKYTKYTLNPAELLIVSVVIVVPPTKSMLLLLTDGVIAAAETDGVIAAAAPDGLVMFMSIC